jgi:hypothetical protein
LIPRLCRPYNQAFYNRSNLLCRGTSGDFVTARGFSTPSTA